MDGQYNGIMSWNFHNQTVVVPVSSLFMEIGKKNRDYNGFLLNSLPGGKELDSYHYDLTSISQDIINNKLDCS